MERAIQLIIFFTIFFSIFGLMQWYILRSYVRWLHAVAAGHHYYQLRKVALLFFTVANIIFLLRFPSTEIGWYQNPWYQYLVIYPGGVFFGAVVITFFLLLILNGGTGLVKGISRMILPNRATCNPDPENTRSLTATSDASPTEPDPITANTDPFTAESGIKPANPPLSGLINRRQFLKTTGSVMMTAPLGFTIGASTVTSHDYQIIRKKLYFDTLPSALNGFRIVQLSDIHSGIYMTEKQIRDIFHLANEQHPDLLAITGDFVDNSTSELPALYQALPDLKAEYGIFGCLGNHDHYASAAAVNAALQQRNVQILTNSHHTLLVDGDPLTLIGIDDVQSGISNEDRMERATSKLSREGFHILLSHRPDLFDLARKDNIDLTLAGHTHGGQIGFDVMGIPFYPIHLFHEYAKGLYEIDKHKLYVNVGIGMVGIPVRLVRPELTIIELYNSPVSS